MKSIALCLAVGLAISVAGCNETSGVAPSTTLASTSNSMHLPAGQPCSDEINRYQQIVKSDLATGNLEQKVYVQIENELSNAAAACSAGKGARAHSIVAASKSKHGYRA